MSILTIALFLSQNLFAAPQPVFPSLKKTVAEIAHKKTIGEVLKVSDGRLDPGTSKFLHLQLKGLEGTHFKVSGVTETKLTLYVEGHEIAVEFPGLNQGRLKPMEINHRQIISENDPTPTSEELFAKILKALPEYQGAFAFLLPTAHADGKASVVMAGFFTWLGRWLAGTCDQSEITKKQSLCAMFGATESSVESRWVNYTKIDEKVMLQQAKLACDQDQLNACADAGNIGELRSAMEKLGQCYQKLIDEKQVNLPTNLRGCVGLPSIGNPSGAGATPDAHR